MLNPSDNALTSALESMPLVAIFRGLGIDQTLYLAEHAWDVGITCVEIPIQSEASYEVLADLVRVGGRRGMPVGAGTVVTTQQVREAAEIGAAFTVSPGFDAAVAQSSIDHGLPSLPGVATATEIHYARRVGFTWLKVFPAAALGPSWFTAMAGPFPDARLLATGGMNSANAETFLSAGAAGVAVGSGFKDASELDRLVSLVCARSGDGG